MTEDPQKELRASDADRERVAQTLHNALSEGRITMAELEERLDKVYSAKTFGDMAPVLADLPGVSTAVEPTSSRALSAPDNRIGGHPGSRNSVAIMSGASRKGNWVLPEQHQSFAFWGGVEIDLRNARFEEKHSTITAVAIMGGIDITVPDDIIVEVTGVGFMGAFETVDKTDEHSTPPANAPVVKINGLAFWGGVMVTRKPAKRRKLES